MSERIEDVIAKIMRYAEGHTDFMGDQPYHPDADEMLLDLVGQLEAALERERAAILKVAEEMEGAPYEREQLAWAAELRRIAEGK